MAHFPRLIGLMLSGAPPVHPTAEALQGAYRPNPHVALFGKSDFTLDDSRIFAKATYGTAASGPLRAATRRTDGRSRAATIAGLLAGNFADGIHAIETASVPVALVDGADDPYVDTDYIGGLNFARLWDAHYHVLAGVGHTPFLQAPDLFRPLFGRFLADMAECAKAPVKEGSATAAAA